jgi:hypothetical protein
VKKPKKYSTEWHQEEDFNALARLYIRGIVTDSERERVEKKLLARWKKEQEVKP